MVKSPATVANEIYIEMRKMRKHFDQSEVLLRGESGDGQDAEAEQCPMVDGA